MDVFKNPQFLVFMKVIMVALYSIGLINITTGETLTGIIFIVLTGGAVLLIKKVFGEIRLW